MMLVEKGGGKHRRAPTLANRDSSVNFGEGVLHSIRGKGGDAQAAARTPQRC